MVKAKSIKNLYWIPLLILVVSLGLFLLFPFPFAWRVVSPMICPGAVYQYETQEPIIALTIDDGPHPNVEKNSSSRILDVLNENQAKATFFVISEHIQSRESRQLKLDPLIERTLKDGHEIGNHLTRDEPSIALGDKFESKLLEAQSVIARYQKQKSASWMRPGVGFCTGQMKNIAEGNQYKIALGSLFPYDTVIPWSNFADWFITNPINLKPGRIIILHDGGDRGDRTVKVLEKILPKLSNKGYRVVTLSELESNAQPLPSQLPLQGIINLIRDPLLSHIPPNFGIILLGVIFLASMLRIGVRRGFLHWQFFSKLSDPQTDPKFKYRPFLRQSIRIFVLPALLEEVFVRGILQRYAIATFPGNLFLQFLSSIFVGVVIFVAYHPLLAGPLLDRFSNSDREKKTYFDGRFAKTFRDPSFILLAGLLGLCCSLIYFMTRSVWYCVILHWIVVLFWILFLGGDSKLRESSVK